jgi:hypothetical protein
MAPSLTETHYVVDASLSIGGIGTFRQTASWSLSTTFSSSLTGFSDVLVPGDLLGFGICGGGACNDPVLFNLNPFNPVLFTGTFPLGLDSSCAVSAPCLNAQAVYISAGQAFGTRFFGTLTVTEGAAAVSEPCTLALFILGLVGLGSTCRRNVDA